MKYAPIALFVYNRIDHTKKTVEALQKNKLADKSELFVFSDGARGKKDESAVKDVRVYIRSITGFKNITIAESMKNKGLADSIISGVTDIINAHERIIVLEDDIVTSSYFLKYMNDALTLYENDKNIASIHGYMYPIVAKLPETFFIKGADCWGWATWKRGWDLFENDGKKLLNELKKKKLKKEFNFFGAYPYMRMLESQILGINNSWAIRWYASAFLSNRLTLYPGRSLVRNIGMDASGTHSGDTNDYDVELLEGPIRVERQETKEDAHAKRMMVDYFETLKYNSTFSNIKFFAKKILLCFQK